MATPFKIVHFSPVFLSCPLFSSDTYLQPTCHVFYLLMSWVTHQEADSGKTGLLILPVHCHISSTQITPATGNCSMSISRMHELWDLQETKIISKCLLSSRKFLLQLHFQGQMISEASPLRRYIPFDCYSVLSAPHTPETTGCSPPTELIVQMFQHGLHPEPGETPASESLEGSCTSPAAFPHCPSPPMGVASVGGHTHRNQSFSSVLAVSCMLMVPNTGILDS